MESISKTVLGITLLFTGLIQSISSFITPIIIPQTPIVPPIITTTSDNRTTIPNPINFYNSNKENPTTSPFSQQKTTFATTVPTLFSPFIIPTTTVPFPQLNSPTANTNTATSSEIAISPWSQIETKTRNAVVNIVCFNSSLGLIQATTGSGVIIDPHGVILTNAHIGQYFLFTKENEAGLPEYNCTIRKGSIASSAYKAKLIYIPELWIESNPTLYNSIEAKGTGENDYALLLITESANPLLSLPSSFPSLPINIKAKAVEKESDILIAGYPAGSLGVFSLESTLSLVSHVSSVIDEYTFNSTSLDLITTDVTPLAQHGSSGGAVVNDDEELVGLIVSTGNRKGYSTTINALTLSYINTSIDNDTGIELKRFIGGNLEEMTKRFEKKAPELRELFD